MAKVYSLGRCIELDLRRKYYGTQEVADELGISAGKVRQLLAKGAIEGAKLSNVWLISKAAYTNYRGCQHGKC